LVLCALVSPDLYIANNMKKVVICLLLALSIPFYSYAQREQDSLALVALYNSTGGANWTNNTNWLSSMPITEWFGVNVVSNRIVQVSLADNNLVGFIPSEIGNLTMLTSLYLDFNQLSGTIPTEIGYLLNLSVLHLSGNHLSGFIPTGIWNLTNLILLGLGQNLLVGTIPSQIGNLNSLRYLDILNDQFNGNIPSEIWNMTNLEYLSLGFNNFGGTIPKEIGNLTKLTYLNLSQDNLSGNLPQEIWNLNKLTYLSLAQNYNLNGTISTQIGNLLNLEYLSLRYNQFTGDIPSEINNLTKLKSLSLDNNSFDKLPELTLDSLNQLEIGQNRLTFGDIEPNINVSKSIYYIPQDSIGIKEDTIVNGNSAFTFTVTCSGTNNMYQWYKDNNIIQAATQATYTIPSLQMYDAGSYTCAVTNTVVTGLTINSRPINIKVVDPSLLRQQDSLALVALYNSTGGANWTYKTNWLSTQPISTWYGVTLTNNRVTNLSLPSNNLKGNIPQDISKLTMLIGLSANNNNLGGKIPSEIGNLNNLNQLNLSNNQLTGTCPIEINEIKTLTSVTLSGNDFDGLPALTLSSLDSLTINNNHLTFEDIEPNINVPKIYFIYSPQDSIGNKLDINSRTGKSYTFSVTCGGSNNIYQWYKNNVVIPSANDSTYTITDLNQSDTGSYTCDVNNTIVTGLTIYSRPIKLSVALNGREQDSLALITLYDSTGGANWTNNTNWLSSQPISLWYGVKVGINSGVKGGLNDTTSVTKLNLANNNLTGRIPKIIGEMTGLQTLNLGNNHLSGSIPDEINNLNSLQSLQLNNNKLSVLPVLTLTTLDTLMINNNEFSFKDIEPNLKVPALEINYQQQDSIGVMKDTTCRVGTIVKFVAIDSNIHNYYQWFKNDAAIASATNNSYELSNIQESDSGSYTCAITNSLATGLTIYQRPEILHVSLTTGINDVIMPEMKIYPNPTSGLIYIESSKSPPTKTKIEVINLDGKILIQKDWIEDSRKELNLMHLSKGMYLIRIRSNNNYAFHKIVLQ
jgi:Leucine-rich repeat (LRR) protein